MSANRTHGLPKCSPSSSTPPKFCRTHSTKHHQKHTARHTSASRTHGLPKCSPSSFTLRPSKCATVGCAWRCWTHSTNTTRSIRRGMSANRKHGLPKCSPANVTPHTSAQLSGVPGAAGHNPLSTTRSIRRSMNANRTHCHSLLKGSF